jgi:hypothetical protein
MSAALKQATLVVVLALGMGAFVPAFWSNDERIEGGSHSRVQHQSSKAQGLCGRDGAYRHLSDMHDRKGSALLEDAMCRARAAHRARMLAAYYGAGI